MEKSKRKKISSFTPRWPMKSLVFGMALIAAAIHVGIFRFAPLEEDFPAALIFLMLLMDSLLLWWGYIFSTQSRVTIYDEGIELERGGAKLFTRWDNVSHLGIKRRGRNHRRGIFLYHKVKPRVNGLAEKLFFGRETNFIPIGSYVHLPRYMNPFNRKIDTDKLLETEFGQTLYEYAPQLFDDYIDMKPKKRLEDDYSNEDMVWYDEEAGQNREQNE